MLSGQVQTLLLQSKPNVSDISDFLRPELATLFVVAPPLPHEVLSLEGPENDFNLKRLLSQPPSSCSFDGSLKTDQSDSEPKWPEVPPVLNQNEDRRRNKYLRKDYLKVSACTCLVNHGWLKSIFCRRHLINCLGMNSGLFLLS